MLIKCQLILVIIYVDLKWLEISGFSSNLYNPIFQSLASEGLTDAVFLELFSLMQLEHLHFGGWTKITVLEATFSKIIHSV
jgi:hypothetical protein